jgi:hypothetical protein
MQLRSMIVVMAAGLAMASMMLPGGGGNSSPRAGASLQRSAHTLAAHRLATDCGTFASSSIYPTARVTALRRVSCATALKVAKAYDHSGKLVGRWACALSHGGGNDLFSCGKSGKSGNLRKWPHALAVEGEGSPQ